MPFLIDLGTALYHTGIRCAAPFVPKARRWSEGRKGLWQRLEAKAGRLKGCLWIHCASTGEFEQCRPLLEVIRNERPEMPVLVTFFSPSGYEARKNFPLATHVEYLPPDGARNAQRFIGIVQPKAAIFIKYEFWYHHLRTLHRAGIPTFLVSAIFRPSQPFFRWYGTAHRAMLGMYTRIFVQNTESQELLRRIGTTHVTVSGDTRFDRVASIAAGKEDLPIGLAFRKASDHPVLVAGSTWPADEKILAQALTGSPRNIRSIIVPHELDPEHLRSIDRSFPGPVVRWSTVERLLDAAAPAERDHRTPPDEDPLNARTLLLDRMGHLSKAYKYADITYVGGGFGTGIHNLLEAAAWGKPVIFGPNHQRFAEALGLIDAGAGFPVRDVPELQAVLERLLGDRSALDHASIAAMRYVDQRTGATGTVLAGIRGYL
jgi:3-deoxy-D-manno-octulosonic-acid transferase